MIDLPAPLPTTRLARVGLAWGFLCLLAVAIILVNCGGGSTTAQVSFNPAVGSATVGLPVATASGTTCPTGTDCASYSLIVAASNPSVGRFAASGTAFSSPAAGDVLCAVEADATKPMSGGTADCSPSSVTTNKDSSGMPLKVTPGATVTAAQLNFTGCS